jgi:hypothetical protein
MNTYASQSYEYFCVVLYESECVLLWGLCTALVGGSYFLLEERTLFGKVVGHHVRNKNDLLGGG